MISTKRKDDLDGFDATRKRARRQDPVSCQTCRTKKLKCDRQQPCSNCNARRIECVYTNSAVHNSLPPSAIPPPVPLCPPPTHHYDHNRQDHQPVYPISPQTERLSSIPKRTEPVKIEQRLRETSEQEQTADWLETIVMGSRIPDVLPTSLKDRLMPKPASLPTPLTAFLPREPEAIEMLNHYIECMDYVYHIIIPSRTMSQFNEIYQNVHSQSTVDLNHLALLFSIAAASHYFRSVESTLPSREGEKRSREYSALVGAALTQGNYMTYPTIEGLQATIIISHCVSNLGQDSSIRAYFIHATIISQAMQLGLHRIDTVQNKEYRKKHGYDPVEVELKRRLWWQLASYDWLLAFLSGPQESTYFIHPAHMSVNLPINIRDEDIGKVDHGTALPENTPTKKMSYALARIKLAVVCREIVDETGHEHSQGTEIEYSKIMELDRRLDQVYKHIPEFFRMDSGNRRKYAQLYKDCPQLSWQRLLLQQAFNARICRLHRYYFIRGAHDAAYSYSHVRCLQSARRVIEVKRIMDAEIESIPGSSLVWFIMHHVFMSAVFLMMDMCFNWDDILADKRREEVMEACRMLDKAQRCSGIVREGINAMMEVLQRYWRPSNIEPQKRVEGAETVFQPEAQVSGEVPTDPFHMTEGDNYCLENTWSELLDSCAPMAASAEEWMGLFTDLSDAAVLMD